MDIPLAFGRNGVCTGLIVVIAKRDWGKTHLISALLPVLAPKDKTVLIDPQGTLAAKTGIERYKVEPTKEGMNKFMNSVLRPAEQSGQGVFLVIDDFDRFTNERGSYLGGQAGGIWEGLNIARGWGVGMLISSHSETQLHNAITNSDALFVGGIAEASSIRYYRTLFDSDDLVEIMRRLPRHVFVLWSNRAAPKQLRGFFTVDEETGDIRELTKEEMRQLISGNGMRLEEEKPEEPTPEKDIPGRVNGEAPIMEEPRYGSEEPIQDTQPPKAP
jgi:hypothetical protein